MKTAKAQPLLIYVWCPHCDEPLECRRTETVTLSADVVFENGWKAGNTIQCPECERPYRLPAMISKLA